jgi:hypothetical protein
VTNADRLAALVFEFRDDCDLDTTELGADTAITALAQFLASRGVLETQGLSDADLRQLQEPHLGKTVAALRRLASGEP